MGNSCCSTRPNSVDDELDEEHYTKTNPFSSRYTYLRVLDRLQEQNGGENATILVKAKETGEKFVIKRLDVPLKATDLQRS